MEMVRSVMTPRMMTRRPKIIGAGVQYRPRSPKRCMSMLRYAYAFADVVQSSTFSFAISAL